MNCKTVRTWMSEYIDGMLDPEHATSFRAHLDECPACRRDLAAMEKTVALVRSMKLVAPPADLMPSVHARLEAGGKPRASLWPMKVFQPVLAIAAGLVLVVGIGAYFLRADLSVKLQKAEARHSVHIQKSQRAVAEKPPEAKARILAGKDAVQVLRLEEKAVALRSQKAVATARAGAGGSPPAATAADKFAGRPERAAAEVADGAGKGAARPSAPVQPAVNLTIATTNRAAVEQVLLAFDVKRREEKKQQAELQSSAADAQVFAVLAQNATLARKSNQAIVIILAASQLQDLLAQLKLQGTISVADHARETAQAPSKIKAADSMSGAAVESSDLLTVHVIITVP